MTAMRIDCKVLFYLFTFSAVSICSGSATTREEVKRPNVMVIFADDVGTGEKKIYMNIQDRIYVFNHLLTTFFSLSPSPPLSASLPFYN